MFTAHAMKCYPWLRGLEGANSLFSDRSASITAAQTMASLLMLLLVNMTMRLVLQRYWKNTRLKEKAVGRALKSMQ